MVYLPTEKILVNADLYGPPAAGAPAPAPNANMRTLRQNIQRLIERGTFTPPAHSFPGATFQSAGDTPPAEEWERTKHLWDEWDGSGV